MNLGALIFGFVALALIVGGIVFVAATTSTTQVVDTYGNTYNANANTTNGLVKNTTAYGTTSAGLGLLVVACLGLCGGVGFLYIKSKT